MTKKPYVLMIQERIHDIDKIMFTLLDFDIGDKVPKLRSVNQVRQTLSAYRERLRRLS